MASKERARESFKAFAAAYRQRRAAHASAGDELNGERDEAIRDAYAKGLTQTEIANELDLSQQLISKIVRTPRS